MTTTQMAGAEFNKDRTRRYVLFRVWDDRKKVALAIGLNPSTANEAKNDRTIDWLVKWLHAHGYGGLRMVNLFTQVTPSPKELSLKDEWAEDMAQIATYGMLSQEIIVCWGTFKEARLRANDVAKMFPQAKCFGINADGSPKHPAWFVRNGIKGDSVLVKLQPYLPYQL